jgi:hypothetical protein
MSAADVIAMIEKLPAEEKAEVYAFVETQKTQMSRVAAGILPQSDAQRIADKVFKDHAELFRKLAQ